MTNVLFLADRTALVKQAKDDFKKYLPDQSLCNLCSSKDDKAARIVFSTYPTMLNAIDNAKTKDGVPLFSLIISCLILLSSCAKASIPEPDADLDSMFGVDKNINILTIDKYLGREDTVYRDMRVLFDPADYAAIGGDADLSHSRNM